MCNPVLFPYKDKRRAEPPLCPFHGSYFRQGVRDGSSLGSAGIVWDGIGGWV